jgi:plastocyanin
VSAATTRRRTAARANPVREAAVRATACLAAVTLVVPACAADDGPPPVQVDLTSEGFDPAVLAVPAGTEVRFVNRTPVPRTVASTPSGTEPSGAGEAGPIGSGRLLEGETYAVVLEDEGEYLYHAVPLEEGLGGGPQRVDAQRLGTQLVGTVRVEEAP